MPFSMITGDLFGAGLPAIGHGCNCAGAMGAGIAVQFKRRYPDMYRAYRQRCREGRFQPGDVFVWEGPDVVVYNLATQPVPGPTATLDAIESSVRSALADVANRGLPALGLPRLGSGPEDWRGPTSPPFYTASVTTRTRPSRSSPCPPPADLESYRSA